jgi:hypothetical protein
MPISDLATLRTAYVANVKASQDLASCREAQIAPQPCEYQRVYEASQQALSAYKAEVGRVPTSNYARPDMNPLPEFAA